MSKARLIKRREIEEREAKKETTEIEEKSPPKERFEVIDWPKRNNRPDPRKAFADLFAQPQTR